MRLSWTALARVHNKTRRGCPAPTSTCTICVQKVTRSVSAANSVIFSSACSYECVCLQRKFELHFMNTNCTGIARCWTLFLLLLLLSSQCHPKYHRSCRNILLHPYSIVSYSEEYHGILHFGVKLSTSCDQTHTLLISPRE